MVKHENWTDAIYHHYCGGCDKTDGLCYASNPPKVKCTITGHYHFCDDVCDCEEKEVGSMESINIVPAIKEIEAIIRNKTEEFEEQIKPYKDSLAQLRKINTACEKCNGVGKVLRSRACAEDDRPDPDDPRDWIQCNYCFGTGRANFSFADKREKNNVV